MNQQDNEKLFTLLRNSLKDLSPKQRNEIAQICINMNGTTSIECYSEACIFLKEHCKIESV